MKRCPHLVFLSLVLLAGGVSRAGELLTPGEAQTNANSNAVDPAVQALSISALVQVIDQLEQYVAAKDLSSIHNEDAILSICLKSLNQRRDVVSYAQREAFTADLATFARHVSDLHLAGDLGQQAKAETELTKVTETFQKLKSYFPRWIVTAAQNNTNLFTCPMHRDVIGCRTNFCPKCGMELNQLIRILPPDSERDSVQQEIRASIKLATPLVPGKAISAILRLERANGDPVFPSDLIETHTKRIHLLMIDRSLTDYHHEHPVPTRTPGEYSFTFTPQKPGIYRAWADLRAYPLGFQEYAMADMPADTIPEPLSDRAISLKAIVDGLNYDLILQNDEIRVGRPSIARLRITTLDGEPFTRLEPVMATFAHFVGFNEDYKSVLHMHPKGPAVSDPNLRGGPELEFQIFALKPGFYRLFAQVQIDGRSRFAPFGIQIVR
jgi:hypothetical protein